MVGDFVENFGKRKFVLKVPSLACSVPKPLNVLSLARSVPKPLKVPSLARSMLKPLKVPSLARSVPKPFKWVMWRRRGRVPRDSNRCRPPTPLVVGSDSGTTPPS